MLSKTYRSSRETSQELSSLKLTEPTTAISSYLNDIIYSRVDSIAADSPATRSVRSSTPFYGLNHASDYGFHCFEMANLVPTPT